jgi:hypothetical protein
MEERAQIKIWGAEEFNLPLLEPSTRLRKSRTVPSCLERGTLTPSLDRVLAGGAEAPPRAPPQQGQDFLHIMLRLIMLELR